jgi:hypothetical protein
VFYGLQARCQSCDLKVGMAQNIDRVTHRIVQLLLRP